MLVELPEKGVLFPFDSMKESAGYIGGVNAVYAAAKPVDLSKLRASIAQEIREKLGEDVFEIMLNFYIHDKADKKESLRIWQRFWQKYEVK